MAVRFIGMGKDAFHPRESDIPWVETVVFCRLGDGSQMKRPPGGWEDDERLRGHVEWCVETIEDRQYVVYHFTDRDTAFLFKMTYCSGL